MAGNWAEISPVKYGLRSMKFSFRIRVQITSIPYTSGPEAPAASNSCPRAALNVLVVHSSRRVNVTGAWTDGLAQPGRRKESNTKQIGLSNLAGLGQPA